MEMNRRTFVRRGVKTAGAFSLLMSPGVLAACGGGSSSSKTTSTALRIAQPDTPALLDGDQAFSLLAEEVMANCSGGDIVRYDVDQDQKTGILTAGLHVDGRNGINDGLAESFTASDDLTEFVFKLRPDAKSYFGNPITAEDVKWSWERRLAIKGVGSFFASVMRIKSVDVIDPQTVRFRTEGPSPLFLKVDAMAYYGGVYDLVEVKKHITASDPWAKDFLGRNTAGFGPYHVASYKKGQQLTLAANPNYPGEKPAFDSVVWRVVARSNDRVALLSRGDVDVATNLAPRELKQLQGDPKIEVVSYTGNKVKSLQLNNTVKPLNDPRVRQALAFATPYRQILDDVYFGLATPLTSPLPKIIPGSTDEFWKYDTDVAKAKQLLSDAGVGSGFPLEVIYDVTVPEDELIGKIMRTALAEIGVRVTLTGVPTAVFSDRSNGRKGQAFINLNYPFVPDAGYHLSLYWQSKSSLNTVGYANPEYDRVTDKMLAETDETKRLALTNEAQRIWLEDMPWLLLCNPGYHFAHRKGLTGISWYGDNQPRYGTLKNA